jgi:hypothetical protein
MIGVKVVKLLFKWRWLLSAVENLHGEIMKALARLRGEDAEQDSGTQRNADGEVHDSALGTRNGPMSKNPLGA